jgi:type II restriction/modification system DNA methylase subunit YeeA
MANPASALKGEWNYYIEPAKQIPEVDATLAAIIKARMREDGGRLNPENDCGLRPRVWLWPHPSGGVCRPKGDLLGSKATSRSAIPRLILENNLYGLDIDDRAAQLAGFALLMKARADDQRLFDETLKLNVLAIRRERRFGSQ